MTDIEAEVLEFVTIANQQRAENAKQAKKQYTVVFGNIDFKTGGYSGPQICQVDVPVPNAFGDNFSILMDEAFSQVFSDIKVHGYSSLDEMRENASYDLYAIFSGHHEDITFLR